VTKLEGKFVVPDWYGSTLLAWEPVDAVAASYLKLIRRDGVTDRDVRWFWDMPNLDRIVMLQVHQFRSAAPWMSALPPTRNS
jgi:hypothetical protein